MKTFITSALTALVCGFAGAALWQVSGLGQEATRSYLLKHPELLQEMAEGLQRKQSADRLAGVADEVNAPFPGAVLGNPDGQRTLVKFTDYGCTYCRMSTADVDRLVRDDPELRVVIREWPIFEGSEAAARMALAAAQQGKFPEFYHAMFEAGPPTPQAIERAAAAAGLDLQAARTFAASDVVTAELVKNQALAQRIGFSGTPSWVTGGAVFEGAVGHEQLSRAIAEEAGG